MNVKAVPTIPSLAIAGANETRDEERRKEKQKPAPSKNTTKQEEATTTPTLSPKPQQEPTLTDKRDLELNRQVIDSEKVVELLSHRCTPKASSSRCFKKKTEPVPSQGSSKKVNRSL